MFSVEFVFVHLSVPPEFTVADEQPVRRDSGHSWIDLALEEFKQLGKDSLRKAEGTGLGLA